jgi:hypothetical protein
MAGFDTQDAQDGAVKALGGREVRDGDAGGMVEHPARGLPLPACSMNVTSATIAPVVSTFED